MRRKCLERMTNLVVILALIIATGGIGLFPQASYAVTYSDDFSTATYRDSANTNADWNTVLGKTRLPQTGMWTKADGAVPGYDNISNNSGNSSDAQIVLDSSQRPNVVWSDTTTGDFDIFFSKWNGTQWTKANGSTTGYDNISNNNGASQSPQIVLDSSQRPNIVWMDNIPGFQPDIYFSRWNGSAWTKADGATAGSDNVSNNIGSSQAPRIVLDTSQRANIVWMDYTTGNGDIFFSKFNGTNWTKADGTTLGYDDISNNNGSSEYPLIALNSSQQPNIIWDDLTPGNRDVFFSKWTSPNWTKADGITAGYDNVSNNSGASADPQFVLDTTQNPNVVWSDDTSGNYDIFFSKWNGSAWTKADDVSNGYDNINNNSGNSEVPQIALDVDQRPNIVWRDYTPGNWDICFSRWNGSAWTKADGTNPGYDNISNNSGSSLYPQMVLESNQKANIVWYDNTSGNCDLLFSRWTGSAWTKADGITLGYDNISNNNGDSSMPKIVLDASQRPNIIWKDNTPGNDDIFFSKWSGYGSYGTPKQAQSLKINTGSLIITKATITANQYLNGQAINYFLSANGGTNWGAITLGTEHTFAHPGNDLRWKAILETTNYSMTPEIDTLTIDYTTDAVPPTGSMSINDGKLFAHSTLIPLSLSATDNVGVTQVMISNLANFSGSSWENYNNRKDWMLEFGDGEKTVYVKFKDANGNESQVYSDSITLVTEKSSNRLFGDTRYETAVEISKEGWTTSNTVILARGDLFPDALAGAPLAAKYDAPILLSNPLSLTKSTADEIKRLKVKNVKVLGSEDAVYPQVIEDLENQCSITSANISRFGGETRYETAAEIAKQLTTPANKTAIVAYGENYPDALASASAAAALGMPILLTRLNQVPSSIQEALKSLKIEKTIVVGGEDVVSSGVAKWLNDNGYQPTRLGGDTRYDTCYLIADYTLKNMGMGADVIGVAFGENFPDALTLGPLAGKSRAPVLLVRATFIPEKINKFLTDHGNEIYQVYIAGGPDVVSEDVKGDISKIVGI